MSTFESTGPTDADVSQAYVITTYDPKSESYYTFGPCVGWPEVQAFVTLALETGYEVTDVAALNAPSAMLEGPIVTIS